jgi:transglutaminase-like putative cysteine protease
MLIILLSLVISLVTADWTDGMDLLGPVVLGGFALGMLMSLSRWSGVFPVLHSLITGAAWVAYWISRAPQVPVELQGADRVAFLLQSFVEWLVLLFGDTPARSNLVFLLELGFLLWWLGYLAAWAVFREGKVWRAIIPIGLILLVNMYFGPAGLKLYFAVFVVCALLLAVRSFLAEQELTWRYLRVRYADDIQIDFLRDGLIFALIVVALATLLPNAAASGSLEAQLGPLRQPWERVQAEWGRLFSSLNYQAGGGRPAFGDSLTLGGPRNLGDTVIMDVKSTAGRYWRAVAYDTYTGRRWLSTPDASQAIDFGSHVNTPQFDARREFTQTVTIYYPAGGVLFAAGQPLRVSLGATADLDIVQELLGDASPVAEITMLHRRGADLRDGQSYLAVSSLTEANIEDLQEAGDVYPEWVSQRYLEVPSTVPQRVRDLAIEVTADAVTPYDKAVALEQFLRGYTYDDQIAAPPPGVDGVDYFLFETQAGYCDYFASAFAIMARAVGIPARVSAGYSQGEYNTEVDAYRVLESDGHSWPEVFFPGYGWVEFEPTASELQIVRPHRGEDEDEQLGPTITPGAPSPLDDDFRDRDFDPETEPGGAASGDASAFGGLWWVGLLLMAAVVAAAVIWLLRPSQQGAQRLRLDPEAVVKLYGRLVQWAQRLRLPLLASQTPNEHAVILAQALPEGRPAIAAITDLYVQEQYSPNPPDQSTREQAVTAWIRLQPVLRQAWLKIRLGPLARLLPRQRSASPEDEA